MVVGRYFDSFPGSKKIKGFRNGKRKGKEEKGRVKGTKGKKKKKGRRKKTFNFQKDKVKLGKVETN